MILYIGASKLNLTSVKNFFIAPKVLLCISAKAAAKGTLNSSVDILQSSSKIWWQHLLSITTMQFLIKLLWWIFLEP